MNSQINKDELLNQAALLAANLYANQLLADASSLAKSSPEEIESDEFSETVEVVKKEIEQNKKVKKAICTTLGSVKNDIRDVTKMVGAALLPLSLSGIVAIPITPIAFAVAGLIIFNAGISTYCAEFTTTEKD